MAYDNFLIDKRVVERNIAKGLVDREQLKQQIDVLPDREANLVHVSLEGGAPEDVSSVDDLDDDDDDLDDADDADEDDDADDDDADDDDDDEGAEEDTLEGNIPPPDREPDLP